jgi:hypothetical protein
MAMLMMMRDSSLPSYCQLLQIVSTIMECFYKEEEFHHQ